MSDLPDARQIVVFTLGDEEYGLPINYVHEIIRYTEPRAVASRDTSVRGVISLRGRIVPVFDLCVRLGLSATTAADRAKIVIVETGSEMAGVVVDTVEEVVTVDEEHVDAAPVVGGVVIDGIAKLDDRLVVLLSPEAIVAVDVDFASAAAELAATADVRAEAAADAAPAESVSPSPVAAAA